MKELYLFRMLGSNYCRVVFLFSLALSYLLIPFNILSSYFLFLGLAFMITMSLTITCMTRSVREELKVARGYNHSIAGIITSVVGISALHICGIGAPTCGASAAVAFISIIFPGVFVNILHDYSVVLITISIFVQLFVLYRMGCFKKV